MDEVQTDFFNQIQIVRFIAPTFRQDQTWKEVVILHLFGKDMAWYPGFLKQTKNLVFFPLSTVDCFLNILKCNWNYTRYDIDI